MTSKYSVLFFKENLTSHISTIEQLLFEGKKVFWFGASSDVLTLKGRFKAFADSFFLQVFDVSQLSVADNYPSIRIVDGIGIDSDYESLIGFLEDNVPEFNAAQYKVEHCLSDSNIVVKASAGTGKTTVMIDRILYLMHTIPNLRMSEIFMITFTNEAANQMNDRLQQILLKKYSLTRNKRYLSWLEQQSQMNISTIDSLAYDLFKRFGTAVGFGRDLEIRPLEYERKNIIKDILSECFDEKSSIISQIGMNLSESVNLLDGYIKELKMKGYSSNDIMCKDWGIAVDSAIAAKLQLVIKKTIHDFDARYRQLKLDYNAISINDLFFDFGHFLLEGKFDLSGLEMKYLFVDEFQDTDATQIKTFARLSNKIGAHLFAVGDVKQSIYGFKGATDAAFDILHEEMKGNLTYFSLRNNYRTCANIMTRMEEYFYRWTQDGLLRYEESVRPFKQEKGSISMNFINKKNINEYTLRAISDSLDSLESDIRSGRKKLTDKTKVAVIVRGNKKAADIAKLCRDNGKTVVLNSDRPFFLSAAVRDFYALINAFVFPDNPTHLYNYLMTPYASYKGVISVSEMERAVASDGDALKYLSQFLIQTKYTDYQKDFRIRPVLSVLKDIYEKENIIDNFIAMDKLSMYGSEYSEAKINKQALIDAKSYQKNLDKLMEMIQQRMEGEFTTLYDLYTYLSLMIATNRDEMEPDIEMDNDYTSVYIMTVHKSKGLEFDTVIMPAMNGPLVPRENSTIMSFDDKVAWFYTNSNGVKIKSEHYETLRKQAIQRGMAEETRMLYVAMTRAVNKIVMLVNNYDYISWSTLIRRVGLINE